jgi:hypothetical protein
VTIVDRHMSFLTKVSSSFDRSDAVPGMAYFRGTGPFATTCKSCEYFGLSDKDCGRKSAPCRMFKRLQGEAGPKVKCDTGSCKYYEERKPQELEEAAPFHHPRPPDPREPEWPRPEEPRAEPDHVVSDEEVPF